MNDILFSISHFQERVRFFKMLKLKFLFGAITWGAVLWFLDGSHDLWFPTPIHCLEPENVVTNFFFLLGTISYGSLLQFIVGNHKLWFPTQIHCLEPKAVASNSDLLLGTISYGSLLRFIFDHLRIILK